MKKSKLFYLLLCGILWSTCSSGGEDTGPTTPEDDPPSIKPPVSTTKFYRNPVLKPGTFNGTTINSMADPFVLKDVDSTYYLYVTGKGFPTFSSKDLVNWTYRGKVFTGDGVKWAKTNGNFWAPEMVRFNGRYYLHYSADSRGKNSLKRIGLAVADSPLGPFVDVSSEPFYSHAEDKGSIDSHIFTDTDGKMYLYYSNAMSSNFVESENAKRSEIWVIKLKDDLSGTEGEPVMLIWPQQDWEHLPGRTEFWNEGATVIKHNDKYYMTYSANSYGTERYAVGYAVADSPMGPFTKYEGNPVLQAISGLVSGTGHNCVIESPDGSELFCVYHSHVDVSVGGGTRMINIDRMGFQADGTLYITGPTYTDQLYPLGAEK